MYVMTYIPQNLADHPKDSINPYNWWQTRQ